LSDEWTTNYRKGGPASSHTRAMPPDLMFARNFGTKEIPGITRVVQSNTVMHVLTGLPSPEICNRRASLGIRVESRRPTAAKGASKNPHSQFACLLVVPRGLPGTLMRYEASVIRVGKHTQAESLRIILMYLAASGDAWPTGITVPNSVSTAYFTRVVKPSLKTSVYAVKCEKFTGVRLLVHGKPGERHTITVHLAKRASTGIQEQSKCTVPGTQTAAELRSCVEEVAQIVASHSGEIWVPAGSSGPDGKLDGNRRVSEVSDGLNEEAEDEHGENVAADSGRQKGVVNG